MEYRISQFARWFSLFLTAWFAILMADEFLPLKTIPSEITGKYFERTEHTDRLNIEYFVQLNEQENYRVNRFVYDLAENGDRAEIYKTPIFKQVRGVDIHTKINFRTFSFGEPHRARLSHTLATFLVIVLGASAAFFFERFEYRLTAFFFASIIAAIRWWFLGV